ncbi:MULTISPECIES: winged helix DNA-binding domain-containing protein [unclassified Streptomyces]|uniref:winged helix DNA-binding domain-containing protein n=1 Tax=unclassified Streptomyces TaxID=2593676 RepID=UPI0029BC657C|nr:MULTISPECIES: winged helix DNA-binding domain-containing protein [unclassified Streptomyces]MDX3767468.1 winged helix DNA-binding domain-containing protein [Streptomyces sp. AK08-01B]MDX3820252.1 winged helix DNA-binding domain-containing protein [Streptomyces sp. AK08-01A]
MNILSLRALNRALLDRQFLLARTDRTPVEVIGRLVALQAQEPNWPYVGLWSRIHGFTQSELTALLEDRQVVRSGLLRSTQHLAAADDFRRLRPLLQPALDRTAGSPYFTRNSTGLDAKSLVAEGLDLLGGGTLSRKELARRLAERHPGRDGRILAGEVELRTPLVHGAATGAWGSWGNRSAVSVTPAEAWLGKPMVTAGAAAGVKDSAKELIRRYLAAFGPAGVKDVQAWCGLTRLGEVVADMHAELRRYCGPDGRELIDPADAELPDPETPAPVRLLPAFDNALLGHADRTRVISDEDRKRVMPGQAQVRPTFLVDGRVQGTWSLGAGTLRLTPFRPLCATDREALEQEADRLLPFVGGTTVSYSDTASTRSS